MFEYKIDEHLSLEMLEYSDYIEIFKLTDESRNYLMEWFPWLNSTKKPEDSLTFIKTSLKRYASNNGVDFCIISDHKIIGIAGFNTINWSNKTGYIGYWLGKKYEGSGNMTKVTKALINYAFYQLNLNKVEIRAASNNKRSRNIPERLHYVNEGCIRQAEWLYDHFVDHIVYGMLKEEWTSPDN